MSEVRVNNLSNENNTGGPTISGITTYSSTHFFVPPQGDTASRPSGCPPGSLRFNTDSAHLEYYRGDTIGWVEVEATNVEMGGVSGSSGSIYGRGTRAIFAGGYTPSGTTPNAAFNNVDALTIETLGNTIDFNNLSSNRTNNGSFSDATRAFSLGGVGPLASQYSTIVNIIEFCIFSSTADHVDFGDISTGTQGNMAGFSDKTRGIMAGGGYGYTNVMEYVTMQSSGDTIDFGDLAITNKIGNAGGISSSTRGYILGGARYLAPDTTSFNTIQVVTISTTGDATDFGDMLYANYSHGKGSNAVRGLKGGGYGPNYTARIEFLTLSSQGDSVYFGDLAMGGGSQKQSAASPTRFVIGGGYEAPATNFSNVLNFVQIATTGDATDFGDLTFGRRNNNGCSNNHGGL